MSNNIKIHQIYYKTEQLPQLDPAFIPWNNIANPHPEYQEWYVWNKDYQKCCDEGLEYWGFLSWKFGQKTNLNGEQFIKFIEDNPGYELYFVNPSIANEALFTNGWEQGDKYHPNISQIADMFLAKIGYSDVHVREILTDRSTTMWCNYIVGSRKFWDGFMAFGTKLFDEAKKDLEFNQLVFGVGGSKYAFNPNLPMFIFLIERLVSIYIELEGIKVLAYRHTTETVGEKYKPYIGDIIALSDLKVLINRYDSDELYDIWLQYRTTILRQHPGILGLE
jgi:hypothetical protein